jgi:uncharacterized membrane protein
MKIVKFRQADLYQETLMDLINRIIHAITEVHPIHPMLVHFPIGLSGAALFFILLALWKNKAFFEQAAFANIALATVATIAAGITGIYDNRVNYEGDAPNAMLKITLAIVLFLVTTITTIARWRSPDLFDKSKTLYVAAYFLSFGLALTLAFLGGVILYGF